jgi:cyclohexyl-isocyanide hydratase
MSTNGQSFVIGIPVFDGMDLMDVAAPREMFSWMAQDWSAQGPVEILLVAECDGPVTTRDGMRVLPDATFADVRYVDVLWVPGADPKALQAQMNNLPFLDALRAWAGNAQYVTSVCEGALILAAAGLLNGYSATTHWAFLECLRSYPEITVVGGPGDLPRFIVDAGPGEGAIRVTGGGISSGLDEALELVRMIAGESVAESVQQTTQYFPAPPVQAPLPTPGDCPLAA